MTVRLLGMAGLVLLTVACGGGSSQTETLSEESGAATTATSEGALDEVQGCALVTREQVASAVGVPLGEGEESALPGCDWRAESGLSVSLRVYAGSMLVPATCDGQKFLVSGREEEVPGLGDSALWGSSGNLVVCTSRAVLKVDIDHSRNDPRRDKEALIQIARAALDALA